MTMKLPSHQDFPPMKEFPQPVARSKVPFLKVVGDMMKITHSLTEAHLVTGSHHVLLVFILLPANGSIKCNSGEVDGKINLSLMIIQNS